MFSGCTSLKKLNIYNFNTDKVINMNSMFAYCSSLNEFIISDFNMKKVIYSNNANALKLLIAKNFIGII